MQPVKAHKALDPIAIGALGAHTVMLQSQDIAELVEELFGLVCKGRRGYHWS